MNIEERLSSPERAAHGVELAASPEVEAEIAELSKDVVRYTKAETREQRALVERLYSDGKSVRDVVLWLRGRWSSFSSARAKAMIASYRRRLLEDAADETVPVRRELSRVRLARMREWASGERDTNGKWVRHPNFGALLRIEERVIELEGTAAPKKLDVDATFQTAMVHVIQQMSPEDLESLHEEAQLQERLAELARTTLPALAEAVEKREDEGGDGKKGEGGE